MGILDSKNILIATAAAFVAYIFYDRQKANARREKLKEDLYQLRAPDEVYERMTDEEAYLLVIQRDSYQAEKRQERRKAENDMLERYAKQLESGKRQSLPFI